MDSSILESLRTLWPYPRYRRGLVLGMRSLALKDGAATTIPLMICGAIDALTAGLSVIKMSFAKTKTIGNTLEEGCGHRSNMPTLAPIRLSKSKCGTGVQC